MYNLALDSYSAKQWNRLFYKFQDTQSAVATAAVKIHELVCSETRKLLNQSGYSFYVTPSSFIHFLKVMCETLKIEQSKIVESW